MAKATPRQLRRLTTRSAGRAATQEVAVVTGAGANTNIAVPGIKVGDILISCLEHVDPAAASTGAVVDRTPQTSITSDGNIQVSVATNTAAGNRLVVSFYRL